MKRPDFNKLFSNKRFVLIFSLIVAVIAWFVTVGVYDPGSTKTISNVPITVKTSGSQAEQLNLAVSTAELQTVSVTVSGPRYKLSAISNEDVTVTPVSIAAVTAPGTYELQLTASLNAPQSDVSISLVNPNKVDIAFDTISSKTIALTAEAPNVRAAEGYILESPVAQPERLTVDGPDSSINELTAIKLTTDFSATLDAGKTVDAQPQFIASDGSVMDPKLFTYNKDLNFSITMPVYKQTTLPLTFKYKNAPAPLDTSRLQYTISPDAVTLAGSTDAVSNLSELSLGYIDIRDLDIGKSFSFTISTPSGFKNVGDVSTATVTFNSSNWKSQLLTVGDIQVANAPAGYTVTVDTQQISNIKIVGLAGDMASLTAADITATVDLSNQTLRDGRQTVPVTIGVLSKDGIWAVGEYTCVINAAKSR